MQKGNFDNKFITLHNLPHNNNYTLTMVYVSMEDQT